MDKTGWMLHGGAVCLLYRKPSPDVTGESEAPMAIKLHSSVKIARIHRRSLHQVTFAAAGIYNLTWGLYTALDPQWLFRFADMSPMRYPEAFACLAMVIGLYGFLYWRVAWRPEEGEWIAAVGLAGKILGPIGYGVLVVQGAWPPNTVVLILTNDVVWWAPFALNLLDASRAGRHGIGTATATGPQSFQLGLERKAS